MEPQATALIPAWTLEDFLNKDEPYAYLWARRENKFMLQKMLAAAQMRAKEVRFTGFMKTWNSYVEQNSPKATIMGDYQTAFPNQPMQLASSHYVCDDYGIHYSGRMGEEIEVCSHPIMPVQRVINIDTNEEKLKIAYHRGAGQSEWRSIIVSKDVTASAQKIVGLAKNGIAVTSENAKELVKYINTIESVNYEAIKSQSATGHLGWLVNGEFAPYCEQIIYDGESPEFARMFAEIGPHGDADTWRRLALETRAAKSVPARIALAASFAAPLVSKLGGLPFFVHLWGTQGCGKTVGLMLAASVWGNPDVGRYIKTFGGTKVSQEVYAAFCCNIPVLLDELQVISDRRMFDDIIYMLCEGVSKGRGAKEGGLQRQRQWSTCILTTGEMPIVQSNSGGGAAVRTIEVNYGGEPLFQDARTVASLLKEHYGHAGKQFIDALLTEGTMDELREVQRRFYADLSGDIQDKQVLSASILLAADWLAEKALFRDGRALTVADIKPYLITREQADVNARCHDWLFGYIGGNQVRFEAEGNNGEVWGVIDKERNVIYIIRSFFDKILQSNGYSPGSFLTWADRRHILKHEWRPDSYNSRKTIGGTRVNCVALQMPSDEDENRPESERAETSETETDQSPYATVQEEDLPF